MNNKELLNIAINAAIDGGKEIMDVYDGSFEVFIKEDDSPLTIADQRANKVIVRELKKTKIPVLSEEGRAIPYSERKDWERLWIVDPLDGTKEFVKRNGEFTVNIALIEKGIPIMGVIYVPVKEVLYFASEEGAFKKSKNKIEKLPLKSKNKNFVAVGSRSHMSKETDIFFKNLKEKHGDVEVVSMGSSLKICLVAEGVADVYPRFAPTMEWDTAAGQAIARYSGKKLIDYNTKKEMVYNRDELRNNWFIVM